MKLSEAVDRLLSIPNLHVVVDSRLVKPGDVFVALPGERTDGHRYVNEAFERGSRLAVVERQGDYRGPVLVVENTRTFLRIASKEKLGFRNPLTIAVTGSNGKTTTKELIFTLLTSSGTKTFKTGGNYNTDIGIPLSVLNDYKGEEIAVFEFGVSYPGDMDLLCDMVEPDIGVVLKVGSAHIGNFQSKKALIDEKLKLLKKSLRSLVHTSLREYVEHPNLTFGPGGQVELVDRTWNDSGTLARFSVLGTPVEVELHNIWHDGMLENLAAAIAVVKIVGLEPNLRVLETFSFPPRRFQFHDFGSITLVDDTYNSSVESVEVALESLRAVSKGRLYTVVGAILEQGWNALRAHEKLGHILRESSDGVFVYGSLRDSKTRKLAEALGKKSLGVFDSQEELVNALLEHVKPKDLVFFKASRGVKLDEVFDRFAAELMKT